MVDGADAAEVAALFLCCIRDYCESIDPVDVWKVADIAVADTAVVVVTDVVAADDDVDVADTNRNVHKMRSEEVEGPSSLP